jgi:hypothetical protein
MPFRLKTFLNALMHRWARFRAPKVVASPAERKSQLEVAEQMARQVADWRGKEAQAVISLGQNCGTAWYLKVVGLKQVSYPFDWVTTSPEIIRHCLADRFQTFLQRDWMVSRGMKASHTVYHYNCFSHRNPKASDADHAYFVRCVERFLQLLDDRVPVIFVTTVLNEAAKRPVWADGFVYDFKRPDDQVPEDFTAMMDAINAINPNARFLFIEEYTEGPFSLQVTARNDRMIWIRHCAMGRSTGVQYLDEVDDEVAVRLYSALKA